LGFAYDAVGNRTELTEDTLHNDYTYAGDSHQLLDIAGATTETRVYDATGNTVQLGSRQLIYDDTGRLSEVNDGGLIATYAYNGSHQRASKTVGSDTTHFVYDQSGRLIAELDGSGHTEREYVYLNGALISQIKQGVAAGTEITLDNPDADFSDHWPASTAVSGFLGTNYQYHSGEVAGPGVLGTPIDNLQAGYSDSWPHSTSVKHYYAGDYQYHAPTAIGVGILGSPIDNRQAGFTGSWAHSTSVEPYYADDYQYHAPGTGANTATWAVGLGGSGSYDVYATWSAHPNRAGNAGYTINHSGGSEIVIVDQRQNGGQWNLLGTYTLDGGSNITLSDKANGHVVADAVTILPAGTPPVVIPAHSETATWTLNAPEPGLYDVYATWTAHA
ncbi:MAG: hypothetical protein GY717_10955, partial [Rhodobacteraceae bacterium]|nr:hypothetical protein [Paracoccaceae bacterium]